MDGKSKAIVQELLTFQESGPHAAPTVVFLHGLIASAWTWQATISRLPEYHCLAVDLPGHGESRAKPWKSIHDSAEQVLDLIATRSGGPAHLVGAALGGMVALEMLAAEPQALRRVLVSGVNTCPLPPGKRLSGLLFLTVLRSARFAEITAANLHLTPEQMPLLQRDLAQISARTVLSGSLAASGFRLPAELGRVPNTLLALAGELEDAHILASLRQMRAEYPQMQTRRVARGRRGWMGEQPELWERALRAWLGAEPLPEELLDAE